MNSRDLQSAWDDGVERALSRIERSDELGKEQLNAIVGLAVQSGIKGGGWSSGATCDGGNGCGVDNISGSP